MSRIFLAASLLSLLPAGFAQTNLGFDDGETGVNPPGWFTVRDWTIAEVRREGCRNGACVMLTRPAEPPPNSFGNVMQSIDAARFAGKRVIYRAAVRVQGEEAEDSAMLWFRVDLPDRRMGFFDNMRDRPIRSGEWNIYEIAGDIEPDAVKVNFGIMAHGKARVWIDDATLETVERKDGGPEVTAAREAIQKQYARMDQATAAGRWNEVLAVALPDAQAGSAAMKRPIARQLEQMKQMTGDAPMTVKNEVMAVTLAGGEAIVRVRGVATMTKAGVPRRYEGSNRDVWVLRDGVWMLKDSTIISQQEVIAELDQAAAKQVAVAIAARAVSLRTAEAGGPVDDLAAFGTAVGNARLVALGEATHGTREIFQMKHRLLEYLVKEKGFTVFAIEANWPESQAADRYIKTGEGNPRQALKDMYFWTWQTDEVLAMLEWMREFNKAPGKHPILSFTSFDMQTYRVALEKVLEFVRKHSPNDVAEVEGNYAPLRQLNERAMGEQRFDVASSRAEANIRLLESRREVLLKATSEQAFNDAVQMARIVVQAAKVRAPAAGPSYRDEMMAKNIEWLADVVYPDEKIVLWAHNGHVSTSASEDYRFKPMGHWLRQRFGTAIYVTGFAIHTGTVRAVGSGGKTGLGTHEVPASKPGSGSGILSATGKPLFFLDLKFGSERALGAWLAGRHSFRECGAIWNTDDAASNTIAYSPAAAFDSLIFIEKTQAARALQ